MSPAYSQDVLLPLVPILCAPLASHPGTTYYVRADGGAADACDGTTDAPAAPGTRACAFAHPFDALPPGGKPLLAGGDRLVIGPGQYRMGPETMAPLPSGRDSAHRTVLVGRPGAQLVGSQRAPLVLNLAGTSHAEVACLEITDPSECVENHGGTLRCPDNGDFATTGLAASDASDVVLRGLDIHGLASAGLVTARTRDWVVEDVTVAGNGLVGWQADAAGSTTLRRVTFDHNGCGEDAARRYTGCASQTAGGWGAGLHAEPATGAWRVEDSGFLRNTSDGLEILHDGKGAIELRRVRAEGNAGAQVRARGEVSIRDSVLLGRCRSFHDAPETFHVDDCRAGGSTLALEPLPGRPIELRGCTVFGEGSALLDVVVPARAGQPRDLCRRLLPVRATATTWEGVGQLLYYRECGGIEGAGPELDTAGGTVRKVKTTR